MVEEAWLQKEHLPFTRVAAATDDNNEELVALHAAWLMLFSIGGGRLMQEEKFLHTVAEQLTVDQQQAGKITAAVFRELRDRLTTKEAADAAAQMPPRLKQLWTASESPVREVRRIHKADFIREVSERAEIQEVEASHAVKVVFRGLQELFRSPTGQEGEAWDIYSQLSKDLKKLWMEAARQTSWPS
jgi:uncharacterized protein (DUF2267 family)